MTNSQIIDTCYSCDSQLGNMLERTDGVLLEVSNAKPCSLSGKSIRSLMQNREQIISISKQLNQVRLALEKGEKNG